MPVQKTRRTQKKTCLRIFRGQIPMRNFVPKRSTFKLLLTGLFCGAIIFLTSIHLTQHRQSLDWKQFDLLVDGGSVDHHGLLHFIRITPLVHYDSSMKYKVIPFAFVGPGWSEAANLSVCIATHTSVNRMQSLAELLLSWKAAASVAVFVSGPDLQIAQLFLGYLQFCYPEALLRVSIHLIHSVERPPIESSLSDGKKYDCNVDPEKFINELLPTIGKSTEGKNETFNVYPQNVLRNSAIMMCPTEWIMTVDADMLPQPSLAQRLQTFLALKENNNCSNCAFVLPTYEVKIPNDDTAMVNRLPVTKEDLLALIKNGSARHFHIKIFNPNQKASRLYTWENLTRLPDDDIHVAYAVNYSFWYEPVFVAKRGFPLYDERFLGFGMTRNTQAYEMFLAGYQFKLLDNAFLVHWGFQEMKSRPTWRSKQTSANYNLFKSWLLEKTIRYDADPLNLTQKMVKNQDKRIFRVTKVKEKLSKNS